MKKRSYMTWFLFALLVKVYIYIYFNPSILKFGQIFQKSTTSFPWNFDRFSMWFFLTPARYLAILQIHHATGASQEIVYIQREHK